MEQVENFEEYSGTDGVRDEVSASAKIYRYETESSAKRAAEDPADYGKE